MKKILENENFDYKVVLSIVLFVMATTLGLAIS
jgi:hypothetical protein